MKISKISDAIVIGMFVFGLALALTQRITHQDIPANNVVEASPQQDHLIDPAS